MTLCDIVIPVYNQPELTKACVESIFRTTRIPVRLIIVDNASGAATKSVIQGFASNEHVTVDVIANAANLGFSKAVNQGMRTGNSPFCLVLNNDTLFTDDCLKIMVDVAQGSADIGIVNPESSTFGVRPKNGETIDDVAKRLLAHKTAWVEFSNCIGFAMLVKREVIGRIGGLDEAFGIAYFEDSDFSMRAKEAGYRCVKACGAYIFHHEHKSLDLVGWKEELFQKNKALYQRRWGKPLRIFLPLKQAVLRDKSAAQTVLSDMVRLARNECYIYGFVSSGMPLTKHEIFREHGFNETANIAITAAPPFFFGPYALYRILRKRKKPYDLVLCYESSLAKFIGRFYPIHRCPVYCVSRETKLGNNVISVGGVSPVIRLKKQ
jgi:GT2 family glycosyltransferase